MEEKTDWKYSQKYAKGLKRRSEMNEHVSLGKGITIVLVKVMLSSVFPLSWKREHFCNSQAPKQQGPSHFTFFAFFSTFPLSTTPLFSFKLNIRIVNYFQIFFFSIPQAHTKSERRSALGSKCFVCLNSSIFFKTFDSCSEHNINIPTIYFENESYHK